MKLINVRKGQFVYYQNKLHRVYSIKPFFKKSVHLIRMSDFKQVLATAREIEFYKPKHLDSFVCNHTRYTLDKTVKADIEDYILVINPQPDPLDQHHLNTIEAVSAIVEEGIITNQSNGIRFNEYWVMVPGLLEGATVIDRQHPELEAEEEDAIATELSQETYTPMVGDIYKKTNSEASMEAMIVAIDDDMVHLGGDLQVRMQHMKNPEKWTFVRNMRS